MNRESPISGEGERAPSEDESGTEKGSAWILTVRKWALKDGNGTMMCTITYKHIIYSHLFVFIVMITSILNIIMFGSVFVISQLNHVVMS